MWKRNQYLSQELYNEELKIRFLEKYTNGTKRFYKYVFQKSFEIETLYNKDVYAFNMTEVDDLIKIYQNGTVESIAGIVAVLRRYVSFAIQEGYVPTRINYLETISSYEALSKYLNIKKVRNSIITRKDLEDICGNCENAQDAICFALPYYGVKGDGNEEILNLTVKNVDFTKNLIKLKDRTIKVDDFLIELLYEAKNETSYVKTNGASNQSNACFPLIVCDYILKTGGKTVNAPAHQLMVNSRIKRVGSLVGYQRLTPTGIMNSGIYYRYLSVKEKNGEVTKEDIIEIMKDYGMREEYWWKINKKMQEFDNKEHIL